MMINEENKTEIIDQYLEGSLSPELHQAVEERIKTDAKFSREVDIQQQIIRTVQRMERETLRQELLNLPEIDDQELSEERPLIPLRRPIFYYAAAVALLMVAGGMWFFTQQSPGPPLEGMVAVEIERTRGQDNITDSLSLTIIDYTEYDFHYQFGEKLILYGDFEVNSIQLHYTEGMYQLQMNGKSYKLKKDNIIHLLRVE
ncbi:MAG: hypothetical protein AAF944_03155 [Bacteroidota bacterium]